MNCIGQPISWPILERYHLMELPASTAREVEEHLKACPVCAACAAAIEEDNRTLPVLGTVTAEPGIGLFRRFRSASVAVGFGIALLFALILIFAPGRDETKPGQEGIEFKGGSPSFTLIRERNGQIAENPEKYAPGDRFRMTVTLQHAAPDGVEVVIFQNGAIYFPYERQRVPGPENNRLMPGAFRITGEAPIEICLLFGSPLPSRAQIEAGGKSILPRDAICKMLTAATKEVE